MGLPQLVQAVQPYIGDSYSQAQRWVPGFSDCSSFLGKGLKALGITPPGNSVTTDYLSDPNWQTIPTGQMAAGDIAVNSDHVIIITGPGTAIGQENPSSNVKTGSVDSLMSGTGSYVIRRYVGKGATQSPVTDTTPVYVSDGGASTSASLLSGLAKPFEGLLKTVIWGMEALVGAGIMVIAAVLLVGTKVS